VVQFTDELPKDQKSSDSQMGIRHKDSNISKSYLFGSTSRGGSNASEHKQNNQKGRHFKFNQNSLLRAKTPMNPIREEPKLHIAKQHFLNLSPNLRRRLNTNHS